MQWLRRHVLENHIVVALVFCFFVFVFWQIREVLISVFWAYILATVFSPLVNWLEARNIHRGASVVSIYLSFLTLLVLLIIPITGQISSEFVIFNQHLPDYIQNLNETFNFALQSGDLVNSLRTNSQLVGEGALELGRKLFGSIFSVLATIVISAYFLLDKRKIEREFISLFSASEQDHVQKVLQNIETKMGAWLSGQVFLSFVVGLATLICLTILGVPFAIPLAVLAGILEAIPMIGPIISAVPAILIGLTVSPTTALLTAGVYILVQQLENHLLVPKIMQKVLGLNPLLIILGVTTGGKLLGVSGALMAIPVIVIILTIFQTFRNK